MQEKQKPDVTILIVNRNAASYLDACLRSIVGTIGGSSAEVILVDGNSTDNSVATVLELWPDAKIIPVPEKLGYVRGNNVGLKEATGRYTMFLNSDTVIYPGAIQELVKYMDSHPDVGAASGAILNPDGSDQGVIRQFPSIMNGIFGRRSLLSRIFPNNRWYKRYMQSRREMGSEPFEVELLSACSLVVRTEFAREIGGMDERFRFYWVDAELCGRISRKGMRVVCIPRAKIMHHEGKGGSTSTFAKRLAMNVAFHDGAYLAYIERRRLSNWDPRAWLVKLVLTMRMAMLVILQFLRPSKATTSGGAN